MNGDLRAVIREDGAADLPVPCIQRRPWLPPETELEYVVVTIDVKEQKVKIFLDKKQV